MERVRILNRKRMGMGAHAERQHNAFCQAFPVRFLLIATICLETIRLIVAHWKFDVLKISIFALEASQANICLQNIKSCIVFLTEML